MRLMYRPAKRGFTLVELLVMMPVALLLVGAVVAIIVYTSSSGLRAQARSQLQLDVLSALDRIEQDVRLSTDINPSSSTTVNLTGAATNLNPHNENRRLVRGSDCSVATSGIALADALKYSVTYSVSGSSYIRKVTLPSGCAASSSNVWQKNISEELIKDATFVVSAQYDSTEKNLVNISLKATRRVAGETVSYAGVMYVRSANI